MNTERIESDRPLKKTKLNGSDPTANPYLAHMNDYDKSYQNNGTNYSKSSSGLSHFQRHQTTVKDASKAEDGPLNPFNNKPLSQKYFDILHKRRDLPVHAQR